MTNTTDLVAAFLAKGGTITNCKPKGKAKPRPVATPPVHIPYEQHDTLADYKRRFADHRGIIQPCDPDYWAAQLIGIVDPLQALKEAAAVFCIARDEGLESARLYEQALTIQGKVKV